MSDRMKGKVDYESNTQKQGRSGSKVKTTKGPAVGRASGNKTTRGGIFGRTKKG